MRLLSGSGLLLVHPAGPFVSATVRAALPDLVYHLEPGEEQDHAAPHGAIRGQGRRQEPTFSLEACKSNYLWAAAW